MRDARDSVKFMQVLERHIMAKLEKAGKVRGITVQELLRSIVVPDWLLGQIEISKPLRRLAKKQLRRNKNRRRR